MVLYLESSFLATYFSNEALSSVFFKYTCISLYGGAFWTIHELIHTLLREFTAHEMTFIHSIDKAAFIPFEGSEYFSCFHYGYLSSKSVNLAPN